MPFEFVEYKLCEKFHCLPSDLAKQPWEKIGNFLQFINLEYEYEKKEKRLAEQKSTKRFPGQYAR